MPTTNYTTQQVYVKEGDDFSEIITIPNTFAGYITAYSNWTCSLMDESVRTQDITGAVITTVVTVYDADNRQVRITADKANTDNTVVEGTNTRDLYGDVRADIDSVSTTLLQTKWNVKRKYRPSS